MLAALEATRLADYIRNSLYLFPFLEALHVVGLTMVSPCSNGEDRPPYQDSRVPVERRIADLLGRMTLEEKAAQLHEIPTRGFEIRDGRVTPESVHRVLRGLSYGTLDQQQWE